MLTYLNSFYMPLFPNLTVNVTLNNLTFGYTSPYLSQIQTLSLYEGGNPHVNPTRRVSVTTGNTTWTVVRGEESPN